MSQVPVGGRTLSFASAERRRAGIDPPAPRFASILVRLPNSDVVIDLLRAAFEGILGCPIDLKPIVGVTRERGDPVRHLYIDVVEVDPWAPVQLVLDVIFDQSIA